MQEKTKAKLQAELNKMVREYEQGEQKLVDFALEHGLSLSLGEYGCGRSLITTQEEADDWNDGCGWSDKEIGDWIYSNETC